MTRHNARHPETGRFAPKVPDAASVDNVSGDPVGEHDEPGDQTHYEVHDFARGPVSHWLPHRRAVMVDAETGEHIADVPEHIMRALVPEERTAAHPTAAAGDPMATFLMGGDQPEVGIVHPRDPWHPRRLRPASRGQGRVRMRQDPGAGLFAQLKGCLGMRKKGVHDAEKGDTKG